MALKEERKACFLNEFGVLGKNDTDSASKRGGKEIELNEF